MLLSSNVLFSSDVLFSCNVPLSSNVLLKLDSAVLGPVARCGTGRCSSRLPCCHWPWLEGCAASSVVCRLAWLMEVGLLEAETEGLVRSALMRSVQLPDLQIHGSCLIQGCTHVMNCTLCTTGESTRNTEQTACTQCTVNTREQQQSWYRPARSHQVGRQ